MSRILTFMCGFGLLVLLAGCSADVPMNPSFSLTAKASRTALDEMAKAPKQLHRPVVVLAGYADLGRASCGMKSCLKKSTGDERVLDVSFFWTFHFDAARDHLIAEIEKEFPSEDPKWTTEVDVIGFSMGGMVARFAALPVESDEPARKQLKVARLFTISSPHRGSFAADFVPFDPRAVSLRSESSLIQKLDGSLSGAAYEMFCYTRLRDWIVGTKNTSPPVAVLKASNVTWQSDTAWWVAPLPFTMPHGSAYRDPRIMADILRRLRDEPAYATYPPAPLP
jgi:hypothetical protein